MSAGLNSGCRALCVSIHDVAPATWPMCRQLLQAVQEVAPIALTLLVVPAWHRAEPGPQDADYCAWLEQLRREGHELALHGYTHLDEGPAPSNPWTWYWRRVYTQSEGEFSALKAEPAGERLQRGRAWFEARGWTPQGFVAPAWLLSSGSWTALRQWGFIYTTTWSRFHLLRQGTALFAPSLVYSARSAWGGRMTRPANDLARKALARAPLLRLGLHPADTRHAQTILHSQRMLERLLGQRQAMTKPDFAASRQV